MFQRVTSYINFIIFNHARPIHILPVFLSVLRSLLQPQHHPCTELKFCLLSYIIMKGNNEETKTTCALPAANSVFIYPLNQSIAVNTCTNTSLFPLPGLKDGNDRQEGAED